MDAFSTHDRKVIKMADRLIQIEDGEVTRLGVRMGRQWLHADHPDEAIDEDEEDLQEDEREAQ